MMPFIKNISEMKISLGMPEEKEWEYHLRLRNALTCKFYVKEDEEILKLSEALGKLFSIGNIIDTQLYADFRGFTGKLLNE